MVGGRVTSGTRRSGVRRYSPDGVWLTGEAARGVPTNLGRSRSVDRAPPLRTRADVRADALLLLTGGKYQGAHKKRPPKASSRTQRKLVRGSAQPPSSTCTRDWERTPQQVQPWGKAYRADRALCRLRALEARRCRVRSRSRAVAWDSTHAMAVASPPPWHCPWGTREGEWRKGLVWDRQVPQAHAHKSQRR